MTGFVAVVRAGSPVECPALVAAGAVAVLGWDELATSTEPDDVPAVLFDLPVPPDLAAAVLSTLTSIDPLEALVPEPSAEGSARANRDVVIATVRPVIDTLKLVDEGGALTGTAQRDEHRFVGTPIAARLQVLRAVLRDLAAGPEPAANPSGAAGSVPTAVAVLAALVERGATVFAGRP